ncbi:molybdopterin molybdotransferase MoeA [Neolewinella persica]|uniref:molybdopterin molybdotransferase MoeA n=1 Tax=Neolewinella persica TaxID=70998 RepID=UPI0003721748|nr:molybdopterin molybdotransferase MoeA [Neolewinella persica]
MLTDYPTARQLTLQQNFNWGEETVPLVAAAGRILAEPLLADRPQPPFDRVTMDGIAIDYTNYATGQRTFPIEGIVAAGTATTSLTDAANCLEVMTGAVMPPGATTVIRYEDLERVGETFVLPDGVQDGKNIHQQGRDAAAGARLMQEGARIGGAAINLLASCGYANVVVKRLPKVAVIATGDELVAVEASPLPHQIRMSNLFHLQHQLATAGIAATTHHIVDDQAVLREKIAELLSQKDILIFSGGVSKGKYDFLPGVLAELGVEQLFHRVAQRPGKPIWVGRTQETMVFGLPGNPVSSLTGLLAYVGPFLRKNLGMVAREDQRALAEDFAFGKDLTLFQVVAIDPATQRVRPVTNGGSGDASSMLRGDGFLVLPRERSTFAAGESFPFLPFDQLL